ncbi:MAG: hypothetical protein K2X03_12440 [Bryobacteraceae bacterium]|nr:hypothetical protein [Bryobacteraceae bacterium]
MDRLYLSYWMRGYTEHNMLRHYATALRKFPFSRLSPSMQLRIFESELVEPPVFEHLYDGPQDFDLMMAEAKLHQAPDYGYELEAQWDLWQWIQNEWKLAPVRVSLFCFGPAFDALNRDHLEVDFGLESHFLPQPLVPGNSLPMVQSNIRSLLKLVQDLDGGLNADRRQLWSESGDNFAERLESALAITSG